MITPIQSSSTSILPNNAQSTTIKEYTRTSNWQRKQVNLSIFVQRLFL